MTISAQQFNRIVLKEDLSELKDDLKLIKEQASQIINSLDGLAFRTYNLECDFAANQSAHDRFEGRLNRIEDNLELVPLFDY